jgi:tetratricopeptide (TPR) repeat protein
VAAGRNEDAVMLLDRSAKWGTQDLSLLMQLKDSLGVPLALSAARGLASTGRKAEALSVLNALVQAMPGYDPAYELFVSLEPQPLPLLDAMYRRDAFEERPLIWQAVVLRQQGRLDEAKAVVQRALNVDPSDGEEGPNDRMRGYAVLADILEAKGDAAGAAEYRAAVAAIRISERSDELHALGLYQRAFAGYREALTHFQNAYCIQSRLAVQLTQQGRRSEALEHYRRAYELMPESFGRVESHCFGCESVFQGNEQQGIAEEVFTRIVAKNPASPQPHYLLGYLREEQRRYADALQSYRAAVSLDPDYLNAWKHLDALAEHIHVDAAERDIARIRLLELDPRRKHVTYDVSSVGDLALLWRKLEKARSLETPPPANVFTLRRSKEFYDAALAKLPDALREQMTLYQSLAANPEIMGSPALSPRSAIASHTLIAPAVQLMGVEQSGFDD